MTLDKQIFAIAPASGKPALTPGQERLLVGKAKWIAAIAGAGLPVVPTICLTRAGWEALQAERRHADDRLRRVWVATLFRLVGQGEEPPLLVVRTSTGHHSAGLMAARTGIAAPADQAESVDTGRPLARAINLAFASYDAAGPVWGDGDAGAARDHQIVIVQAMAKGELLRFLTRDAKTGILGPAPAKGHPFADPGAAGLALARILDPLAGQHLTCLIERHKKAYRFVSARCARVSTGAEFAAAIERVETGVWTPRHAVGQIDPARLPQLLHARLRSGHGAEPVAAGLGVSAGAASGHIAFDAEDAARIHARGSDSILVAIETGPADIDGLKAAAGILTARGGMTSHAAVVARVTGKPCVAGLRTLEIDSGDMTCMIGGVPFKAGDLITIDGSDGGIYEGRLPLSTPHIGQALGKLLDWSDGSRTIAVRTNVETVEAAKTALDFGAEGIGLARSEHMFFSPERLIALRRMILSESEDGRAQALSGLVDYQTGDYAALFAIMAGRPVNVRLFDPPLHEFLPRSDEDIDETAASLGLAVKSLRARLERLSEINPMLGHRGCRLAITYPEILDMQMRALVAGARAASARQSAPVNLEVMVPFVSSARELSWVRAKLMAILDGARLPGDRQVHLAFGTMIELPRAALRAGAIAPVVDFLSFGTNDLTQSTFGISRDDAPAFLATYLRKGLYDHDPFVTIDETGVGELMRIAIERGKAANPDIVIGICGEHAGDPASIRFFASLGVDYVSCSPYRVPIARLGLAQQQG